MRPKTEIISDFDLQAIVDGEYDPESYARVMEKIKNHRFLSARLDELIRQKSMLRAWWDSCPRD